MAPILPRHVEEQDAPPQEEAKQEREAEAQVEEGKTPQGDEAEPEKEAEAEVEREAVDAVRGELGCREVNRADGSAAARCCEVNPAEASEADLAEKPKVLKVLFFPLLGLLGRITASSPRVICTVEACPSEPMLSARALNILRVGMGAATRAVGIF